MDLLGFASAESLVFLRDAGGGLQEELRELADGRDFRRSALQNLLKLLGTGTQKAAAGA